MDPERLRILQMIQDGQITAVEGAALLDALEAGQRSGPPAAGRSVRLTLSDLSSGQVRASGNLPIALVEVLSKAGSRVSRFWSPHVGDLDLLALVQAAGSGSPGKVADVADQDTDKRWEIFVE